MIKRSATCLKDLKNSRHFPRVQAILQTQSLVPLSASGVCECILNKPKYGTNIRLPMQRYIIHLITSARRSHRLFSLNSIKVRAIRLETMLSMKTCHEKLLEIEFFFSLTSSKHKKTTTQANVSRWSNKAQVK